MSSVGAFLTPTKKFHFKAEVMRLLTNIKSKLAVLSFSIGTEDSCSANTLPTLRVLIERLKAEGLVDVFRTVKRWRSQRPAMVQTKYQYEFIYKALAQGAEELFDKCRPSELLSTVTNQHLT